MRGSNWHFLGQQNNGVAVVADGVWVVRGRFAAAKKLKSEPNRRFGVGVVMDCDELSCRFLVDF